MKKFKNLSKVATMAICLASSVTMFAQDVIIMRNGDEVQAIVEEVRTDEVKYRRFDNQQGPIYTLKKSEIFMIRYENGRRDVFDEVVAPASAQSQRQTSVNFQQQSPVFRYTFGEQISSFGQEKSPFTAGFLSFLIPGVGQFYNGDVGGGFLFLSCNVACNLVWMRSARTDNFGHTYFEPTQFFVGFIGALAVNITSIVHASRGAKKVNAARGYRLTDNTYLNIQPTMILQNNFTSSEYAYGMNFCLKF